MTKKETPIGDALSSLGFEEFDLDVMVPKFFTPAEAVSAPNCKPNMAHLFDLATTVAVFDTATNKATSEPLSKDFQPDAPSSLLAYQWDAPIETDVVKIRSTLISVNKVVEVAINESLLSADKKALIL